MDLHERLRGELQATAVSDAAWPELLLRLADLIGATEATLGGGQRSGQLEMFAPRTDLGQVQVYHDIFHQQNVIMRAVARQGPGAITVTDTLPENEGFRRSDFYNLWCVPQRFNHAVALNLATSTGWAGTLVINTAEEVTTDQIELVRTLAPDLSNAVERWSWLAQLRLANRMTLDALDLSGQAALMLDRAGRVIDGNQTAQAMLGDGRLQIRDGQLGSADTQSTQNLARIIARCLSQLDHGIGRTQITGPDGPLSVQCVPFPPDMTYPVPQRPVAMVMIADPGHRLRQRLATLTRLYGLTRAEAELAIAVVEKGSRKAAALARGVSDTTARSQLTSIFDKTGVRRQTELVRLLMVES
ncbi:helix-turn-helix transcriptional regulator [Devosia sediminis]|uniref:HTH luxR-type domain-containing protein n=1 Tax=Devosia sediminis TaxID=2798801 RepID=A0A934MLN4_9HYPH|nr:hypothetical protein [Devosia sediminis]MBJ3784816.1 hypothetical protein [Devosia sediminis]